MTIQIQAYSPAHAVAWDALNRRADRGHLIFNRDFMDYHSHRFQDASLTAWHGDALVGILPANVAGDTVYSHRGLTFGGLVVANVSSTVVLDILQGSFAHYRAVGAQYLVYRPAPWIYATRPSEADLYGLQVAGARLVHREITSTVDLRCDQDFSSRRRRGIRRSQKAGISFSESGRWSDFWFILTEVLESRHGTRPVHSLEEIELLASRFPDAIRLYTAEEGDGIVAGMVVFETRQVAHAQYIAVAERGREVGALDGLIATLIEQYARSKRYFDFGISTEEKGMVLNRGLLNQKEEFGGRPVVHDTYEISL